VEETKAEGLGSQDEERKSESSPEDLSVSDLSKKGYKLLKEKYIEEAEDCFRMILEVDECNNYALVGLGDAARKRKSYREAIGYYQSCLEHHEKNNYALFGRLLQGAQAV
jgi:tetratricopeptide (TPR) repeat protein